MALGALGAVFCFWLGLLIAMKSDTMYLHIHSHLASTFACWVAALVTE
jgi:hypothetical protein